MSSVDQLPRQCLALPCANLVDAPGATGARPLASASRCPCRPPSRRLWSHPALDKLRSRSLGPAPPRPRWPPARPTADPAAARPARWVADTRAPGVYDPSTEQWRVDQSAISGRAEPSRPKWAAHPGGVFETIVSCPRCATPDADQHVLDPLYACPSWRPCARRPSRRPSPCCCSCGWRPSTCSRVAGLEYYTALLLQMYAPAYLHAEKHPQ